MLVDYVLGALEHATYEKLDSGRYYGSIPAAVKSRKFWKTG